MISPILLAKRCHRSVARSFVASWGGMEATWAFFGTMAPNGCGRICKAPVAVKNDEHFQGWMVILVMFEILRYCYISSCF